LRISFNISIFESKLCGFSSRKGYGNFTHSLSLFLRWSIARKSLLLSSIFKHLQMTKITDELQAIATPERAKASAWFFKTGKGQYGEGDVFIGISNPDLRAVCKNHKHLTFIELQELLNSPIHEYRFAALVILVEQMKKAKAIGEGKTRQNIYGFYLDNAYNINNWDLVDCSARDIVGLYLFDKDRSILYDMARTDHLWTQRIAIIATSHFINNKQFYDTLKISEILLSHKHDLIHKAVGWMLREAWKKGGEQTVEDFLEQNIGRIPRTALRYAIEKMTDERKKYFMSLR
jgi:3-methyladenine DNA glycosylase AlkD